MRIKAQKNIQNSEKRRLKKQENVQNNEKQKNIQNNEKQKNIQKKRKFQHKFYLIEIFQFNLVELFTKRKRELIFIVQLFVDEQNIQ